MHRIRFELGGRLLKQAKLLRDAGKLAEAMAEFQKAYDVDPASDIAGQEIRRTQEMIDREKNGGRSSLNQDTSSLTPADFARKVKQERIDALQQKRHYAPPFPFLDQINHQQPAPCGRLWLKLTGINVNATIPTTIRGKPSRSGYGWTLPPGPG